MKKSMNNKGYLLLEGILSISLIVIIVTILCSLILVSTKIKTKIEDKVEMQQQASDIINHISDTIENSKKIINIKSVNNNIIEPSNETIVDAISVKCKYRDKKSDKLVKDREISLKKNGKVFINTLFDNGVSEPGGYEVGAYVDKIYIRTYDKGRHVDIRLILSKNDENYEANYKTYIRDFKEHNEGEAL